MRKIFIFILMILLNVFAFSACAQEDKFTLTITPPLIKNNISPGESWGSYVKIINNNIEAIKVYAHVFDFKSGPDGGVEFLQSNFEVKPKELENFDPFLLSQWLEIEEGPIELGPNKSKEIPFVINVPQSAEPGGHYAAILIGTKPNEDISGSGLKISSLLSSLIMVNVRGHTVEKADIREFSTSKIFYDNPKVDFVIRFENTGNVHVQPRGEIKIYDFWGREKGSILINHNSGFGNVLPDSVRKWQFFWEGKKNLLEMGRYKASLVLAYGEEARETAFSELYFWIIYWKILFGFLAGIILSLLLVVWLIRSYIRRAVRTAQKTVEAIAPKKIFGSAAKSKLSGRHKSEHHKIVDLRRDPRNKK